MKDVSVAMMVLALVGLVAVVVVAQEQEAEQPVQEVTAVEVPVEMIPVFQVNTRQMAAPRYIRLDGNVDCNPTNDGGMFCFETRAAAPVVPDTEE